MVGRMLGARDGDVWFESRFGSSFFPGSLITAYR